MRIVAVYNIKGGVGKTATSVNIAWHAARDGLRTLVWDLDPQGASSFYFRIKPKVKGGGEKLLRGKRELDELVKATDYEGLDLLPADFSYRHMDLALGEYNKPAKQLLRLLRPLAESYDLVLLDCPPSISLVSESVFRAADALLIPMIPTVLSVRTLEQILHFMEGHELQDLKLMPFFSMVDRRKRMHTDLLEELPKRYPIMLPVDIPYASEVERMGYQRAPVGEYAPNSSAAQSYQELWREVRRRVL